MIQAMQRMAPAMEEASAPFLADLLASLGALGQSLGQELAPSMLLRDFSSHLQRALPHDRLVLASLDDDGCAFTIVGEHAASASLLHARHDTTASAPPGRYRVADWSIRPVFTGETMLVEDADTDPRLAHASPAEQRVRDAGYRSAVLVPLLSAGRVIGALSATSAVPRTYGPEHAETARRVAHLIAPFVESAVLLQRERRRMERLRGVGELPDTPSRRRSTPSTARSRSSAPTPFTPPAPSARRRRWARPP